jgi:hypothetical protein
MFPAIPSIVEPLTAKIVALFTPLFITASTVPGIACGSVMPAPVAPTDVIFVIASVTSGEVVAVPPTFAVTACATDQTGCAVTVFN